MIPDQWYAILEPGEVPPGRPVGVTRLGARLVLWRDSQGQLACQGDRCAHRGAAPSKGKVLGDCIECPFHGVQYDATGRCRIIPANGRATPVPDRFRLETYPVREAHGFICYMWWGKPRQDLPPVPFFDDIDDSFSYLNVSAKLSNVLTRTIIAHSVPIVNIYFSNWDIRRGRIVTKGPGLCYNYRVADLQT